YGEGFGIAPLEAQACGTPVVVSDFSAQTELCGAGWTVTGRPWWVNPYRAWWQQPDVDAIVAALEQAYTDAAGMRDQAAEFAKAYDADLVYEEHWRPVLHRLLPRPNRAQRRAKAAA